MASCVARARPELVSALVILSANPGIENVKQRESRLEKDTALAASLRKIAAETHACLIYPWSSSRCLQV
eukprot:6204381-Pleurochrysis_carterae.AAC.2